ncbi:hypothetical protein [Amycolatopsis orientalis]|uniref:hypothetical protein n=1 Tax=Amycolatopsis orientalis TaxID=31958 RepID=UPI000425848C|nr:hypothetical protein [Amycolatopsis orientalis]
MRLGIVFVPLFVLVAACGGGPPPPSDPGTLLLRAKTHVGMPSPKPALLPEFSLYGGGRLLVPGESEGALQVVREKHLDDEAARSVYDAAYDADLDRDEYVPNDVIDGYLLVFTLYGGHQVRASTPEAESGGRLEELADFREDLAEVAKGATEVAGTYRPTRLAAIAWASSQNPESSDVRPWPFASFTGTRHVDGGLCVVVEGEAVREAEKLARSATVGTRWRTAETTWLVVFRPLLPDEKSCADLVVPPQG